jgi:hypothetical protein
MFEMILAVFILSVSVLIIIFLGVWVVGMIIGVLVIIIQTIKNKAKGEGK